MSAHFTAGTLKFLRGLARHNDRTWFEARRAVYEAEVKAPMLALIGEINASMIEFAPDHVRVPHKTMLRIYRDTRFSNDKRPYKRHIAAWFGRRTAVRTTGTGFYLHVSATEVHLGMGIFMPLPEHLLALRRYLAENHGAYRKLIAQATRVRRHQPPLTPADAQALARMPKGYPADHPAGELLRARRWGVVASWPAETALEPDFARAVIRSFTNAAPVVLALDAALQSGGSEPSDVAVKPSRKFF